MDINTLTTSAWQIIQPLLPLFAAKGAEELGKQSGGALWEAIKKKFDKKPETKKVVEKLIAQPQNTAVQGAFQYHLEELLENDQAFLSQLEALVEKVGSSYTAKLEGDGAIAQGEGATAVGAGGVYIGGNSAGNVIVTGDENLIEG